MKTFTLIGYSVILIGLILNIIVLNNKVRQLEIYTASLVRVAERQTEFNKHIIDDLYRLYEIKGSQE